MQHSPKNLTPHLRTAVARTALVVALATLTTACGADAAAPPAADPTEEQAAVVEAVDDHTATPDEAAETDGDAIVSRTPTLTLSPPDRPGCSFPLASEDGLHVFVNRADRLVRYDLTTGDVIDHGPDEGDCPGWVGDPVTGRTAVSAGKIDGTWLGPLDGELDVRLDTDDEMWLISRAIVGNRVVFGSPDSESFHVFDATTGEQVVQVSVPDGDWGLTFGGDGTLIGITSPTPDGGGEAIILDAATGNELHRVAMESSAEESVFDLATGELLAPTSDGKLVTIDVETGQIVSQVDRSSQNDVVAIGVRPDGMVVVATRDLLEVVDRSTGPTGVSAAVEDTLAMRVRPDGTVLRIGFEGEMEVVALEGSGPLLDVAPRD